jgi:C-terminal processing protease CtpA/Prc
VQVTFLFLYLYRTSMYRMHDFLMFLQIGDLIVKVDDKKVTLDDYEMRLLGCDVPGSKVLLTVLKPEVRKCSIICKVSR